MATKLYWIDSPWPGKLAIASRPRGGEWLQDEMRDWRDAQVHTVLSLLTPQEERDLDLSAESGAAAAAGMESRSLPIEDRQVPSSPSEVAGVLDELGSALAAGRNIVVHCRQGIGRSGMIAACLLVMRGQSPDLAVETVERARGVTVPETEEQRRWIDLYASSLTQVK